MCCLYSKCTCSYVFVILRISLTWLTSITDRHGTDVSSVPVDTNKSKQLWEETSKKKIRTKHPSGHYLCPEYFPAGRKRICFCKCLCCKALHTPGGFCPSPSPLEMTDQRKAQGHRSSLTLDASFPSLLWRKRGEREEALGTAWTINSP